MKNLKYDVLDEEGNTIASCLTNKEFVELFGLSKNTCARHYARNKSVFKNNYRVIINEKCEKKQTLISAEFFTEKMLKEWIYMNQTYGKRSKNSIFKQNRT